MYSYDRRNFRVVASDALPKDSQLEILLRKGQWPRDMFTKGTILVVLDGGSVGGTVNVKIKGQSMGGPYDFRVLSEKEGVYTLLSDGKAFGARGLKVKIKS